MIRFSYIKCEFLKNSNISFLQSITMANEHNNLLAALKFLCGESKNICRLCLAFTNPTSGETVVNVGDSSVIKRPYYEDSVTYSDMLGELGVTTEDYLPEILCNTCAETVTNAYLFKRLRDYSHDKWSEVINRLNSSLSLTLSVNRNVKSVYLIVNSSSDMLTSRESGSKKKTEVLLKLQKIMKSRKSYAQVKSKHKSVYCVQCNEKFKSNRQLSKHNVKVHNKSKNVCPQCLKIFATPSQLECHAERVHYPKKIKCPKCEKMFSTYRMLKYHDKSQHEAAVCKLCCVQCPSKRSLRTHLDKHEGNTCPKCGKSLINIHTFKAHLKLCGSTERIPRFFCDICQKGYVNKNGIRSHLKTDHGFGNVLTCKYCDKKYDAISKLKNHMVKHTGERNFQCSECGNKFVTQAALVYHVRLHTGERPFPCDLCDESFLSASRRMEHKRRKHYGPSMQCPLCPMKFVTSSQLKKHERRHSNPHSKLYCPVSFTFVSASNV